MEKRNYERLIGMYNYLLKEDNVLQDIKFFIKKSEKIYSDGEIFIKLSDLKDIIEDSEVKNGL